MTKASDNAYPSILITEGTEPSAPAAGKQRLYIDSTTHKLKRTDSSGTDVTIEGLTAPGAATSYTPALTASSVNPTLGSGSAVAGHYIQIGKLVICWGSITFGASGVAAGTGNYSISFPVTAISTSPRTFGSVVLYDSSTNTFHHSAAYYDTTTVFRAIVHGSAGSIIVSSTLPWTWAASDVIIFQLTYEAA